MFGLLDFNILWPILAWCMFWKLWTVYFFNFTNSFWSTVNCRWLKPRILNPWIGGFAFIYLMLFYWCGFLLVAGQVRKQDEGDMRGRNSSQTLWGEDGCKYFSLFLIYQVTSWLWCMVI
jgi:hypothetical protein